MTVRIATKKLEEESLLDAALERQRRFEAVGSEADRKAKGQFFTPPPVARFMAGCIPELHTGFRLLDPGAGTGALTLAVCDRLLQSHSPKQLHVHMFETDPDVLPVLKENLSLAKKLLSEHEHELTYVIDQRDFILDVCPPNNPSLFSTDESLRQFDGVITNPPYFKINKGSAYARAMDEVVHGQPNIYSLFLAQSARFLRDGGNLIAITPRSFCNGLYFRQFRKWILKRMTLEKIHLFGSRTGTFREAKVLQESVITQFRKSRIQSKSVRISRTPSRDFSQLRIENVESSKVIEDSCKEKMIYIPETIQDGEVVEYAKSWNSNFSDLGLKISTGPVVMFRTREFLLYEPQPKGVPLLSAHNIKPFETRWPVEKKKWPLEFMDVPDSKRHLVPTKNYVLLNRFSAKEERRRLTAGCLFSDSVESKVIALENHINYIYHESRDLTEDETVGIAGLFNSVFYDRYFRSFSGNTQVNATEVRMMKFPELSTIQNIGIRIAKSSQNDQLSLEQIVMDELDIDESLQGYLLGMVQ